MESQKRFNDYNRKHYTLRINNYDILKYWIDKRIVGPCLYECNTAYLINRMCKAAFEYTKFHWSNVKEFNQIFLDYLKEKLKGDIELVETDEQHKFYVVFTDKNIPTYELEFYENQGNVFCRKIPNPDGHLNILLVNTIIKYLNKKSKKGKFQKKHQYVSYLKLNFAFYDGIGEIDGI